MARGGGIVRRHPTLSEQQLPGPSGGARRRRGGPRWWASLASLGNVLGGGRMAAPPHGFGLVLGGRRTRRVDWSSFKYRLDLSVTGPVCFFYDCSAVFGCCSCRPRLFSLTSTVQLFLVCQCWSALRRHHCCATTAAAIAAIGCSLSRVAPPRTQRRLAPTVHRLEQQPRACLGDRSFQKLVAGRIELGEDWGALRIANPWGAVLAVGGRGAPAPAPAAAALHAPQLGRELPGGRAAHRSGARRGGARAEDGLPLGPCMRGGRAHITPQAGTQGAVCPWRRH